MHQGSISCFRQLLVAVFASAAFLGIAYAEAMPTVAVGRIERLEQFPSRYVAPRNVDVWLPSNYSPEKHYSVLYVHDGQMMFDATTTWNKQAWDLHEAVNHLVAEGQLPDTIIVGVWNSGDTRVSEYFPAKALEFIAQPAQSLFLEQGLKGQVLADRYLKFLVEELKPAIDRRYSTLSDASHTFIMGSSYGGLISLYAISEYPEVFSGAACLSTHWIGGFTANATIPLALFRYFQSHLPDPATHRIYIDRGTEGLDALYATPLVFFDQIMKDRGYQELSYASRIIPGASHTENDWKRRLGQPLTFMYSGVTDR